MDDAAYQASIEENPYALSMLDSLDKMSTSKQAYASKLVADLAENKNYPDDLILTEAEKAFIRLLRRVPAAEQPIVIEKILSALDNQE